MRVLGMIGLFASVLLLPRIASAGRHDGDAPVVRDHRTHDDAPVVRDHRTHDDAPVVRDHRTHDDAPVVRDHRTHDDVVVRDHRTHDDVVVRDHRHRDDGDDVYFVPTDEVVESDGGGSSSLFSETSPAWTFELGGIARRFRGPAFSRSGSVETTSGDTASYDLASGAPSAGDTAGGAFAMRFGVPMSEHTYAGVELELGGLTRTPIQLMTDSPEIHVSSHAMIGTAAVVGARARAGIAELDGEVAGGMRVLSMTVQSLDAMEDDPSETESAVSGIVEARLRGLVWVAPHVYLAAQAGVSVLDHDDVNVGLSLGISSHAFGR